MAAWLTDNQPDGFEPGIIHGDYQFANVMFAPEAPPARIAAIVDWEMSTVGDPLLDLGWVVHTWRNQDEPSEGTYVQPWHGMPDRQELVDHYAQITGRDVSRMDYYVVLAGFKLGVLLEGHWARACAGLNDTGYGDVMREVTDRLVREAAERVRGERAFV